MPLLTSQVSVVHVLLSLQTLVVPTQTPVWQASLVVHALPSVQTVPLTTAAKTQLPVTTSQVSAVQALLSLHTLAVPRQLPFWQTSPLVHALPSLQAAPLARAVKAQLPLTASQLSVVQALLSLHTLAVPAQVPLLQMSLAVQATPSLQPVPSATFA